MRRLSSGGLLLWGVLAVVGAQDAASSYDADIRQAREMRVSRLRGGDFSPLKKVRSHPLKDAGRMTVGSAPASDIRLDDPGVAPTHAVVEGLPDAPVLKPVGGRVSWTWNNEERPVWILRQELALGGRARLIARAKSNGDRRVCLSELTLLAVAQRLLAA